MVTMRVAEWRQRREQWRLVGEWERERPADFVSADEALAWNKQILVLALRSGPVNEQPIEGTSRGIARMRDVLRHLTG